MQPPIPKIVNENFYKWFGDSKSIDDTGRHIIFYHKSRSKVPFVNFNIRGEDKNPYNNCYGVYFVAHYHKEQISYIGDGVEYYVFLKYKNPFFIYDKGGKVVDMEGKNYEFIDTNEKFCREIQDKGYDSIIIMNTMIYHNEYIVFNNSQIKSIENNGNYSNDENIYE